MNAAATWVRDGAMPRSDLPIFTRLLPGLVSALALAPAALAYELRGTVAPAVVALLWLQTLLLAVGAMSLVAIAHDRLRPWEGRVAPTTARERVRMHLLRDLGWMAAIGLAGPMVLAAVLDWQMRELRLLPGVPALLSAGLGAALVVGLGWQGRAPRVLMLPALVVLVFLAWPGSTRAISHGEPLRSLAILACVGLLGCWLVSRRSLRVCASPMPAFRSKAWGHRLLDRIWRTVPYRWSRGKHNVRQLPFIAFALLPQFPAHAERMHWLAWGQAFGDGNAPLGYGLWMLALGVFAGVALIAPPLHWRHRLAPGGLTARRWARRLVLGSMLFFAASVGIGLAMAGLNRPFAASVWASALGDVLLAASAAAWLRGRPGSTRGWVWIAAGLGLGLGCAAVVAVMGWLGLTPQRGAVWLLIQWALILPMTWAAIRAWAQQDLNEMA